MGIVFGTGGHCIETESRPTLAETGRLRTATRAPARGRRDTPSTPAGSGIGLAPSRRIAGGHQGTLTLEDRTDARGCVATLTLPV